MNIFVGVHLHSTKWLIFWVYIRSRTNGNILHLRRIVDITSVWILSRLGNQLVSTQSYIPSTESTQVWTNNNTRYLPKATEGSIRNICKSQLCRDTSHQGNLGNNINRTSLQKFLCHAASTFHCLYGKVSGWYETICCHSHGFATIR